ncbi:MAG: HAD-IIB family hydrolase [Spirochaetales bacterium]|jgi:HAD superfamily hydrolase (TIGR01484 family)|nr:HAD-IIB family hydrolase [Spirochaetales bacterium]
MSLPLENLPVSLCVNLEYLFTDIDDTLTSGGLLPDHAYTSLWKLMRAGIKPVPVTGGPAGWCDLIARLWPVAGVIGESGAFYFVYDREKKKMRRVFAQNEKLRQENIEKKENLRKRILEEVPGAAAASDQIYRIADLAIDIRQDVPPLPPEEVEKIYKIVRASGAVCATSSIHVNCWFGDYDKISSMKDFLVREAGRPLEEMQEKILYIGDALNDEPAFREIRHCVGVANILPVLGAMKYPPRYICENKSAEGFTETAEFILKTRSGF